MFYLIERHKEYEKKFAIQNRKVEKIQNHLIKNNMQYPVSERLAEVDKFSSNGKIRDVRLHYVLSINYGIVVQEEFAQHHFVECKNMMEKSLNEFLICINLAYENVDDDLQVSKDIEIKKKGKEYGCYAILLDRYDDIPIVTAPEVNLYKLIVENETIDASQSKEFLDGMISAISVKDSEKFEEALRNRMKEVRMNSVDFGVCADFYSMALIKEALKAGMTFYKDYVEVDLET